MNRHSAALIVVLGLLLQQSPPASAANFCDMASAAAGYAAPFAAKAGLGAAGFTAKGVATGSVAAGVQSAVSLT